jgi:hypothetical protein
MAELDSVGVPNQSSNVNTMIPVAKWSGRICASVCALLFLAQVAVFAIGMTESRAAAGSPEAAGVAMGWGMINLYLFALWIPVGIFCLLAAVWNALAWGKYSSPEGRTALFLSLAGPTVMGILFLVLCAVAGGLPWK